jgi:hypothetical protein
MLYIYIYNSSISLFNRCNAIIIFIYEWLVCKYIVNIRILVHYEIKYNTILQDIRQRMQDIRQRMQDIQQRMQDIRQRM